MDELDVLLVKQLLMNSRASYRELAGILGVSSNAVYKRVQKMVDEGVIRAFTAKPSLKALNGFEVLVWGASKATMLDTISQQLGLNANIYFVGLSGGNFLYIAGYVLTYPDCRSMSIFLCTQEN